MFFELFSYVEGLVNPSKIDNLNELAKDLANGSVVQVDADVDGELAVSGNEFQADKDFGNPVEGDGVWKSFSSIGEEFGFGGQLNQRVPNVATVSIGATVVEKHNPNNMLKMADGGGVAEGWTDAELMADGGGVSKRGGLYSVGDKVMVNDNGYVKYFHGFDLTKPATIISKGKVKSSRGIVYFYGLELADGRKPFNNAPESLLTLVKYAKGGGVDEQPNARTYNGSRALTHIQKNNIEEVKTYVAPNGTNVELVAIADRDSSTGMTFAITINGMGLWATNDRQKAKEYYNEEIEKYKQTYANGGAVRHHVPNTVTHSVGATVVDVYHKNPIVHVPSTVTHSVGATVVDYGKGGKVHKTQQSGESNEAYDELAKSKGVGYRFTDKKAKKLGKKENAKPTQEEIKKFKGGKGVYFENRKNRSDVSRMKKLEEGGEA